MINNNNYYLQKLQTMNFSKIEKILFDIAAVQHPKIDLSLTELGIVRDIDPQDNHVEVLFAFPFANIPIADQLVGSIREVVEGNDAEFSHKIVVMTDAERKEFMRLEASAWKGEGGGCGGC